jgi:hypothetical protein
MTDMPPDDQPDVITLAAKEYLPADNAWRLTFEDGTVKTFYPSDHPVFDKQNK